MNRATLFGAVALGCIALAVVLLHGPIDASSHREAPLISNDPLADNTDLYAFRSPDDTNTVTIIADYIPLELPEGGPNYATFGKNIRYEVHIDNNPATAGDDIIYRFALLWAFEMINLARFSRYAFTLVSIHA